MKVLFRLALLVSLWHAPFPMLSVHGEEDDDHHRHAPEGHVTCSVQYVFPCEFSGCEHSPLPGESETDHSTHIAMLGYGAPGKTAAAATQGNELTSPRTMAALNDSFPAMPLGPSAELGDARHSAAIAAQPMRAALQVFLL